ncbi:hypothetical protein JHV675_04310 [Mycobacterium avium subsp. hominissuis]
MNPFVSQRVAHRTGADHFETLADTVGAHPDNYGALRSAMMANDQHQPASSRTIAALATTGRFLRWSNRAQRLCGRVVGLVGAGPQGRGGGVSPNNRTSGGSTARA